MTACSTRSRRARPTAPLHVARLQVPLGVGVAWSWRRRLAPANWSWRSSSACVVGRRRPPCSRRSRASGATPGPRSLRAADRRPRPIARAASTWSTGCAIQPRRFESRGCASSTTPAPNALAVGRSHVQPPSSSPPACVERLDRSSSRACWPRSSAGSRVHDGRAGATVVVPARSALLPDPPGDRRCSPVRSASSARCSTTSTPVALSPGIHPGWRPRSTSSRGRGHRRRRRARQVRRHLWMCDPSRPPCGVATDARPNAAPPITLRSPRSGSTSDRALMRLSSSSTSQPLALVCPPRPDRRRRVAAVRRRLRRTPRRDHDDLDDRRPPRPQPAPPPAAPLTGLPVTDDRGTRWRPALARQDRQLRRQRCETRPSAGRSRPAPTSSSKSRSRAITRLHGGVPLDHPRDGRSGPLGPQRPTSTSSRRSRSPLSAGPAATTATSAPSSRRSATRSSNVGHGTNGAELLPDNAVAAAPRTTCSPPVRPLRATPSGQGEPPTPVLQHLAEGQGGHRGRSGRRRQAAERRSTPRSSGTPRPRAGTASRTARRTSRPTTCRCRPERRRSSTSSTGARARPVRPRPSASAPAPRTSTWTARSSTARGPVTAAEPPWIADRRRRHADQAHPGPHLGRSSPTGPAHQPGRRRRRALHGLSARW